MYKHKAIRDSIIICMGNTESKPCIYRRQFNAACNTITAPASQAVARLLLRNAPHAIFSDLPTGAVACFVDDECINVLAVLNEDYPNCIPFSVAKQWVEIGGLSQRNRSASI